MMDAIWFGNSVADWLIAAGMVVVVAGGLYVVRGVVVRRFTAFAERTSSKLDDYVAAVLAGTRVWFLVVVAVYFGSQVLVLPVKTGNFVSSVVIVGVWVQVAMWGNRAIGVWLADYLERKRDTDTGAATSVAVLGFIAKLVLWTVLLLVTLDNLGFNITALVTSLGIGGVAVALAVQSILSDIFASLSIAFDKPFGIGDSIVVDDLQGSVEYVGLKTTRLRSVSGEQIIFSNAELLKSRIRNYGRMYERRVVFGLGVVYETAVEKIEAIPGLVRGIVEGQAGTRFERAHFKKYGDSSLDFEVVYFVTSADYNLSMDIQQAINLAIFRKFKEQGIEFAYPTRTVYMQGGGGK